MCDLQLKATKLCAVQVQKNCFLGGLIKSEFKLDDDIIVSISQFGKREIVLSSIHPKVFDELILCFQDIEKLLMLFDGKFYTIEKLTIINDKGELIDVLDEYNKSCLGYFSSKDIYKYSWLSLISFQDILTKDLFKDWINLLEDLDIVFQVFLYASCDNKMPIDLNLAFLIELAEPFAELIKERTYYCQTLAPGERGTTLKRCIDELIIIYGEDIFASELNDGYALFLEKAVKSRIRIMHIKKSQESLFDEKEFIKYTLKFSVLYRKILLSLLGISNELYDEKIKIALKNINAY